MGITQKIESTLFHFGFQECRKKNNLNFLKLGNQEYLLMRIFERVETVDLIFAKFYAGDNPCNSEPYFEESIKLSFSPDSDNLIIKEFIEKYK